MNNSLADQLKARAAAMNRRQQNSTDSSRASVTPSLADVIQDNAKLQLLEKLSFNSPEAVFQPLPTSSSSRTVERIS
jgi:hypothetical protein